MSARIISRTTLQAVLLGLALSLFSLQAGSAQDPLPINHHWVGDRILVTWACDHFQGTVMAVVVADSGLVVIDTGLSPTTVRRQRQWIEGELGRSDFRYLVNTHMHNDHVFANEVFPEATVVGPAHSVASLEEEVARIPELLQRLRSGQERYQEWAAGTSPDSADGQHAREGVAAFAVGIADLERGIQPRPPTLTFQERHTLDMGDVHLELFAFSGLHSDSDILILVAEEGVLFTGDAFWGGQLPTFSFESKAEVEGLLASWKAVLESPSGLEMAIPGHSDVPLTVEQFRGMYAYLARLWEDVQGARTEGTSMLRFLVGNGFAERYPEVADFNYIRMEYNLHQHNVYMLWGLAEG
jgi:glyoxylase-like metal-dependent hydrolase (beta-lactamase superfamily II)